MAERVYNVVLSEEQKEQLNKIAFSGNDKVYRIVAARALLKANAGIADPKIATALEMGVTTVASLRKRFVQKGLDACLNRQEQERRFRKVTGEIEARIAKLACEPPPAGRKRWTLDLLTDRIIELNVVPGGVSRATVGNVLKKTKLNPGLLNVSAYRPKKMANL
jgi:transposase